jgi:hypothetical protein
MLTCDDFLCAADHDGIPIDANEAALAAVGQDDFRERIRPASDVEHLRIR